MLPEKHQSYSFERFQWFGVQRFVEGGRVSAFIGGIVTDDEGMRGCKGALSLNVSSVDSLYR